MGNWHISIQGVGSHHNKDSPTDANRMAKDFVTSLQKAGHHIENAEFTHGGKDGLIDEPQYVTIPPPDHESPKYIQE